MRRPHDDDRFAQPLAHACAAQPLAAIQAPTRQLASARDSAWLGQPAAHSEVFQRHRDIDRWLLSTLGQVTGGLAPATLAAAGRGLVDTPARLASQAAGVGAREIATAAQRWVDWSCGDRAAPTCPFEPLPQDKRFDATLPGTPWPYPGYGRSRCSLASGGGRPRRAACRACRAHHEEMVAFRGPAVAGHGVAIEQRAHQPGGPAPHPRGRRHEPGARHALHAVEDPCARKPAGQPPAGAGADSRVVARGGVHAGPRGAAQPADGAHPVHARHAAGAARARADRARMDHEVLRARPRAAPVAGEVPRRPRPHGLRHLLEEPRRRKIGTSGSTTITALGVCAALDAIARRHPTAPRCTRSATASAARCLARPRPPRWRASGQGGEDAHAAGGADRLHRSRRALAVHRREPGDVAGERRWRARAFSTSAPDAGHVPDAALAGPGVVLPARHVPAGRARAHERADGLERGWHAAAVPHAQASTCAPCSSTTRWHTGDFHLGGHAVHLHDLRMPMFVVGAVQDHVAPWRSVFKLHEWCDAEITFGADRRWPQRRHRQPAGPNAHQPSHPAMASRRPPAHTGRMAGQHRRQSKAHGGPPGLRLVLQRHSSGTRNPPPMGRSRAQRSLGGCAGALTRTNGLTSAWAHRFLFRSWPWVALGLVLVLAVVVGLSIAWLLCVLRLATPTAPPLPSAHDARLAIAQWARDAMD